MCSAMGQQALVVEAIQAGAKDFVVKPFQPSRVLEAVQRVLGWRSRERQRATRMDIASYAALSVRESESISRRSE